MSSPYIVENISVTRIMLQVLIGLLPGIAAYAWYFGPAILVSITLATVTALVAEAAMLKARGVPVTLFLSDLSAVVTAWLLALSLPPLAPWWLIVAATAFAIVVAKQLYGGLGNNPFNPAMVGYAVMIISFPVQMTQWPAPLELATVHLNFIDQLGYIFLNQLPPGVKLDGISMATPLDTVRTQLHLDKTLSEIAGQPIFGDWGGKDGERVALAFLLGGLYLLQQRVITWHMPAAFIAALGLTASVLYGVDNARYAGPLFHLLTGAALLGAFFIVTDPVTGATTPKGKLIFAAGAGFLTCIIRVFGGYPDGVAFAVLLMNLCVPLIDMYTQPPVFGNKGGK